MRYGRIVCIIIKGSDQVQHHNSHYHRYDQVYLASKLVEHIRNIPNCLQRHNVQVSGMDEYRDGWKRGCCPCYNDFLIVLRVQVHDLQDILGVDREKMEVAEILFSGETVPTLYT